MINFIKLNISNFVFIIITLVLFIFPILGLVEIRIPIIIGLSLIYFFIDLSKLNLLFFLILFPVVTFYFLYFYNNEYLTNWEDVGCDTYEITYNQNNQKKILDENIELNLNYDVFCHNQFRKDKTRNFDHQEKIKYLYPTFLFQEFD